MPYTYQNYLDDLEAEKAPEKSAPASTYKYSDYLAEQEADKPIKEWLKLQNRENAPITPEIRKRFERSKTANPNLQPAAEWLEPTTTDKIKGVLTNTLGSSGSQVFDWTGSIYDRLNYLSQPFLPPKPKNKITEFTLGDPEIGSTGKIENKIVSPKNILEMAAESQYGAAKNIGEAGFESGSLPDTLVRGTVSGMTLPIELQAIPGPFKGKFPLHSSVSATLESQKQGDTPIATTAKTLLGFAEGMVLDNVLHNLSTKVKNIIPKHLLTTAALTAIPEAKSAVERIVKGENPADIDWGNVAKAAYTALFLPAIMGTGVEGLPSKRQLKAMSAKDQEMQWRRGQQDIQEADIKGKFDKLPQEMTPNEKAAELADLRAEAVKEFGEVDNVAKTEITPPGASGPQFEAPVPEVAEAHGGVAGRGRSVEELNRPFEYVKLTGGIQPDALGKTGDPRTNLQRGEPILKKFTDKDTGRVTLEIDDMNGADAQKTELIRAQYEAELNKKAPPPKPERVKAPTDMVVPTQTGMELEIDKGENITLIRHGKNTFEAHDHDTGIIDLERAARIDPKLKGELNQTTKPVPPTMNKLPTPEAPKSVAKPVEPTNVINTHSAKTVKQAAEIKNTTDELTEMMGEAATHLKMNLAEQGRMASELPPDLVSEVATIGLEAFSKRGLPVPVGSDGHALKAEAAWVLEKSRAIANGDAERIMELSRNSAVQEQISQSAKSLALLRGHAPNDPVYQIMEIRKQAEETVKKNLGNKKVAETTTKRVAELERIIADQTKKIEDYENRKTIKEFKYEARKKGRLRTKEELGLEFSDLVKSFEHLSANQANIGLDPKIIRLMGRMAVNRVEAGIKTIEQVVDDIYTAVGEKIDKRVIRDAITGYGKRTTLSKDEIDKQLRELKRQGRLISQIEDAENGLVSLRSGLERDMPSDRVKELTRILEETKRKNGLIIEKELKEKMKRIPPTEEERQLTAIEKYKNYIKKRTADLEGRLSEGDYSVKPRKVTPIDKALQNQKDHVTRLSKEYNKLKQLNELRTNGVTKEEAVEIINRSKIVSEKKALVVDWADRNPDGAAMEYGRALFDFYDYTNGLKQRAKTITRKEWLNKITHGELLKSVGHGLSVASGASKSMLSSMDNSALGRQGIKMLWSHPTVWSKNAKRSWVDLFGKHGGKASMREVMAEILSRPNAINGTYGKMKLDVGNIEEAYPVQAPEKIPVFGKAYKRTESAFTGFQYRNRADAADIYLKIAEGMGVDVSDKTQMESIGNLVNTLTGRGHLGKSMERAAGSLNNVFFAPKFFKSNWDFLTMHMMTGDTGFVRKQAAINMMKFVAGTAAVLAVAKALGANIELDPRSSDFAKIRFGSTRFDVTGGVASVATLATRLIGAITSGLIVQPLGGKPLNTTKSSVSGGTYPLTAGGAYQRKGLDVLVDAIGGKLAPLASLLKSGLSGVDNNRKPLTVDGILLNAILPIGWQNIIQGMPNKDKANWIATHLADFVGVGTSTYGKEKKKSKWKVVE